MLVNIGDVILESYKKELLEIGMPNLIKIVHLASLTKSYKNGMLTKQEFMLYSGAIAISSIIAKSLL